MIEVELKAHVGVGDLPCVQKNVASFAQYVCDFDKLDAYWHGPEWRVVRGTKGFRMRKEAGETVITFKTKRCQGGIEINRESEFSVSDPEAFKELILRLGCEPFYNKRKTGKRYTYLEKGEERPFTIEVFQLEGLGPFIEIEALLGTEDPERVALAQGEIRSLLARAGVEASAIESRYYSELLMSAGLVGRGA